MDRVEAWLTCCFWKAGWYKLWTVKIAVTATDWNSKFLGPDNMKRYQINADSHYWCGRYLPYLAFLFSYMCSYFSVRLSGIYTGTIQQSATILGNSTLGYPPMDWIQFLVTPVDPIENRCPIFPQFGKFRRNS
jgi:hypothetical protein